MLMRWLKKIESGRFEAEIIPLELTGNFGKHLKGQGKLVWTRADISIEAVTDGGEALFQELMSTQLEPGQILPNDYYLRLAGSTRLGWEVVIERLQPHCHSTVVGHPATVWQFTRSHIASQIHFRSAGPSDRQKGISWMLLEPDPLRAWPRGSEYTYDNPRFGMKGSRFDWLDFTSACGHVSAQKRESGLILLRIDHDGAFDVQHSDAIRLAFSYLGGKMVNLVALESHYKDHILRVLFTSRSMERQNRFSSPLGHDRSAGKYYESFLAHITNLLVTPKGEHVANLLYACLDSVDNTFTTRAMVLCS